MAPTPPARFYRESQLVGRRAILPGGLKASRPATPGILPISSATLWRMVKSGKFPQPVKLADRVTAWRVEDVQKWAGESQSTERLPSRPLAPARGTPPAVLPSGKIALHPPGSPLAPQTLWKEQDIVSRKIPTIPSCGVYFLICGDRVVYVGQSVRVAVRLEDHRKAGKVFDSFQVIACSEDRLDVVESLYIHTLMPSLNGGCPTKESLKPPISFPRLASMIAATRNDLTDPTFSS